MYEDDDEDSDSSKLGRAPAYLHPFAPSLNANHSEKFVERPEDANVGPSIPQEVMNMIRTKEAWIEEIQRLRLALQKGYLTKVKSNTVLLGRTHRDQTPEKTFLGEEIQEDAVQSVEDTSRDEPLAPGAPSRRKGKRRADESELAGTVEHDPRKRLRNAV